MFQELVPHTIIGIIGELGDPPPPPLPRVLGVNGSMTHVSGGNLGSKWVSYLTREECNLVEPGVPKSTQGDAQQGPNVVRKLMIGLGTRGGHSIIKLNTTCDQSFLPLYYMP